MIPFGLILHVHIHIYHLFLEAEHLHFQPVEVVLQVPAPVVRTEGRKADLHRLIVQVGLRVDPQSGVRGVDDQVGIVNDVPAAVPVLHAETRGVAQPVGLVKVIGFRVRKSLRVEGGRADALECRHELGVLWLSHPINDVDSDSPDVQMSGEDGGGVSEPKIFSQRSIHRSSY